MNGYVGFAREIQWRPQERREAPHITRAGMFSEGNRWRSLVQTENLHRDTEISSPSPSSPFAALLFCPALGSCASFNGRVRTSSTVAANPPSSKGSRTIERPKKTYICECLNVECLERLCEWAQEADAFGFCVF